MYFSPHQRSSNFQPPVTQPQPDNAGRVPDTNPDSTNVQPDLHPAHQSVNQPMLSGQPDQLPEDLQPSPETVPSPVLSTTPEVKKSAPESSSDIAAPDGWIDRVQVEERLSLAGIELDDRRIRHLCTTGVLESIKARNERNQLQHFINPASVDQYISKHQPKVLRVNHASQVPDKAPDTSVVLPDRNPDINRIAPDNDPAYVAKQVPASSGQVENAPDKPEAGREVSVELAAARAEIEGYKALVSELRDDKKHLRDQLAQASEFKQLIGTLTEGSKQNTDKMLQIFQTIAERSPKEGERSSVTPKPINWRPTFEA